MITTCVNTVHVQHKHIHVCTHLHTHTRAAKKKKRAPDSISEEFARWPFVRVFVGWNERGRGFKAVCIKCALAWKSIPDGTQIAAVQTLSLTPAPPTLSCTCLYAFHCTPLNTHTPQRPESDSTHIETHTDNNAPHGANLRSHRQRAQFKDMNLSLDSAAY